MINKTLLEKVVEFNFWQKKQIVGIPRTELKQILRFVDDPQYVLSIAGVRRAGKTFLSRQILQEKIRQGVRAEQTLYINFEDPILEPHLHVDALTDFYESYRYELNKKDFAYIVFDEIQHVPKWEKWVRVMLEKKVQAKFIVTGSSSQMHKTKQAAVLTGRGLTFILTPLSFSDFLTFKQYSPKKIETDQDMGPLLTEYLEFGGFPLIVLEDDTTKKQVYLKELFDDIITKDIILRYKLRESEVKKLAVLLINQFASMVSVRRLRNLLTEISRRSVSPTSINNYLEYFADSFIFLFFSIFSHKVKDVLRYPRKAYSIDTGLVNALALRFSDNLGRLYENAVAVRLWQKSFGSEALSYWKDQNSEVDFVVREGKSVKQLIQVCFKADRKETRQREISALIAASERLQCQKLLVITKDEEAQEQVSGRKITYMPLWKWLREP